MRKSFLGLVAIASLGATGLAALAAWPVGVPTSSRLSELPGNVAQGAYLARASGCIACHTNIEGGGAPLAGGVALETPFGTLYSPNLTTDPEHGLGDWKIEDFARAVRQGLSPEGQPYYPAFTYPFYQNFTDQQIADLWAAFQTVPAVAEQSVEPDMPFPFNQRATLKVWRALYLDPPRTDPVPDADPVWNRGKELVEGATHCGACHTGRTFLGGRDYENQHFKGSDMLPGGGKAPAIDTDTLVSRGWDIDNLAYALRTGITPSGDAFGNAMGEVVLHGTKFLGDDDLIAIATYLLDEHG